MSNEVHLSLQGKGGVGKSFVASLIVQTLYERRGEGRQLLVIDTDPVNVNSVSRFFARAERQGLSCLRLPLSGERSIAVGDFQQVIDIIANNNGHDIIIDVGTSVFDVFYKYLTGLGEGLAQITEDLQRPLSVHMPLVGAGDFTDTITCLQQTMAAPDFAPARFVAWINNQRAGQVFTGADTRERYGVVPSERLAVIDLPELEGSTLAVALMRMSKSQLTFLDFDEGWMADHGRPQIEGREALSNEIRWCRRAAAAYRKAIAEGWPA